MSASSPFRPDLLKGKVALVTGGGTGINLGIVRAFLKHGAFVAIMGRRENVLKETTDQLAKEGFPNVLPVQGDVRSPESADKVIKSVVSHWGHLDILVNGAAGNFLSPAEDLSTNGFKTVVDIDLIGTFNMSRAAFAELQKTKGNIINISATLHYTTTPYQVHASAAKAGVDSVTTSLAAEWGDYGIRVNGIAPGPIKGTEGLKRLGLGFEELVISTVPLGRMGEVSDIGNAALFLASDAASSYVTGDTIIVDGGSWLWHPRILPRENLREMQKSRQKKQEQAPKAKL